MNFKSSKLIVALAASMLMSPFVTICADVTAPVINVQTAEGATKLDVNIKQETSNVPYYEKPEYAHLKTPYSVRKVEKANEKGLLLLLLYATTSLYSFMMQDMNRMERVESLPIKSLIAGLHMAEWTTLAAAGAYLAKTALAKNSEGETLTEEHLDTINEHKAWSIAGLLAVGGVIAAKCAAMAGLIK